MGKSASVAWDRQRCLGMARTWVPLMHNDMQLGSAAFNTFPVQLAQGQYMQQQPGLIPPLQMLQHQPGFQVHSGHLSQGTFLQQGPGNQLAAPLLLNTSSPNMTRASTPNAWPVQPIANMHMVLSTGRAYPSLSHPSLSHPSLYAQPLQLQHSQAVHHTQLVHVGQSASHGSLGGSAKALLTQGSNGLGFLAGAQGSQLVRSFSQPMPQQTVHAATKPRRSQKGMEDNVRRTIYVSYLDLQVTEELLASFFSECGAVQDCRICGDPKSALRFAFLEFAEQESVQKALLKSGSLLGSSPLRVLPSKTAIVPVSQDLMPRSGDEVERCSRTVYVTNIDKKVDRADVRAFFEQLCGNVSKLRLLGDMAHPTRIAFVEFGGAEGAMAALNCSGALLGSQPIRVSPSKTPVRAEAGRGNDRQRQQQRQQRREAAQAGGQEEGWSLLGAQQAGMHGRQDEGHAEGSLTASGSPVSPLPPDRSQAELAVPGSGRGPAQSLLLPHSPSSTPSSAWSDSPKPMAIPGWAGSLPPLCPPLGLEGYPLVSQSDDGKTCSPAPLATEAASFAPPCPVLPATLSLLQPQPAYSPGRVGGAPPASVTSIAHVDVPASLMAALCLEQPSGRHTAA
ncbi:hypothetical protein QJQ45_001037 [Haematococcus lacustris]|nr:hypothetical protein QJQ45_001037 [Haematococcus lacustris]